MHLPVCSYVAFAIYPQQRLCGVARDKIIARDMLAIPPARFDAFRAGQQRQRAAFAILRRGAMFV